MNVNGIIIAHSKLETLNYFSDCIKDAAEKDGRLVYMIDTEKPETYLGNELDLFTESNKCIAVFFNQIGLLLTDEFGNNYWDAHQIPVYSFQVDHPRNFTDAMINPIRMLRVLSIDKNHKKFVQRFFPKVPDCHFLPNGGTQEVCEIKPLRERSIDVLYVGECQIPVESFPLLEFFEDKGSDFYGCVISDLLSCPGQTTEEAIENYFLDRNIKISDEDLLKIFTSISIYVETYIRREFKQVMLQALDKRGIKVDIYGGGWENENYAYGGNIRFHSRITSSECNEKIGDAKITLNCIPWFKDGSSERPFNTMLNGSLCMIDKSDYLLERFTDETDICFFDIQKPEDLADKIEYYLSHLDEAQETANRGYAIATENDTWENRLKTILAWEDKNH